METNSLRLRRAMAELQPQGLGGAVALQAMRRGAGCAKSPACARYRPTQGRNATVSRAGTAAVTFDRIAELEARGSGFIEVMCLGNRIVGIKPRADNDFRKFAVSSIFGEDLTTPEVEGFFWVDGTIRWQTVRSSYLEKPVDIQSLCRCFAWLGIWGKKQLRRGLL